MGVARAPQQLAAGLAERVERAEQREVAQRLLLETDAPRELVEAPERPVQFAFTDDRLRLALTETLHRFETQSHVVHATRPVTRDRVGAVDGMHRVAGVRALL